MSRATWGQGKYGRCASGAGDAASSLSEITEILRDTFFRACLELAIALGSSVEPLAGWVEGCLCRVDLLVQTRRGRRRLRPIQAYRLLRGMPRSTINARAVMLVSTRAQLT
eukprot:4256706-Alexandrium_andersonii.AAC.1